MATEWYSTSEAAEYLGVSAATVKRWVYKGTIEFVQYGPGSPIRFSRSQLDTFIDRNTVRHGGDAA